MQPPHPPQRGLVIIRPVVIQKGAIGTDTFKDFVETVIGATGQLNSIKTVTSDQAYGGGFKPATNAFHSSFCGGLKPN
ncbi:MAG: hypothetical protein HWQ58_05740 [Nostoc sp. LPT]|nr:hypothetical protein [Nostoc sp. LPT]